MIESDVIDEKHYFNTSAVIYGSKWDTLLYCLKTCKETNKQIIYNKYSMQERTQILVKIYGGECIQRETYI